MQLPDLCVAYFEPPYWAEDFEPPHPTIPGFYVFEGRDPVSGPFDTRADADLERRMILFSIKHAA